MEAASPSMTEHEKSQSFTFTIVQVETVTKAPPFSEEGTQPPLIQGMSQNLQAYFKTATTDSFLQQAFVEYLLCIRCHARSYAYTGECNVGPVEELTIQLGRPGGNRTKDRMSILREQAKMLMANRR